MSDVRPDKKRLLRKLKGIASPRILVLGDLILDRWLIGKVDRLSPEAPVPVIDLQDEHSSLGGAANVARNLRSLGARVTVCGLVGKDQGRKALEAHFAENDIDTAGLIAEKDRPTTVKTRVIGQHQQIVRVDRESREAASPRTLKKMTAFVDSVYDELDGIIISDYGKGTVALPLLDHLRERLADRPLPVVVDPKDVHFSSYRDFTVITPNLNEASLGSGFKIKDDATLLQAGWKLQKELNLDAMLITRGADGMSLFERGADDARHLLTRAREVYDVTGAGDTVVAALALALSHGMDLVDAAQLANFAAGVVVGEMTTVAVTREQLRGAINAFVG